jgi:glycopeptide antibiotics resistance protein
MNIKYLRHYLLYIWFAVFAVLAVGKINISLIFWDFDNTVGTINIIPFRFLIQTIKVTAGLPQQELLVYIVAMCKNFLLNIILFAPFGALLTLTML